MVKIVLDKEQLEKINSIIGRDLVKLVKDVGGEVVDEELQRVNRVLVLNRGAHDVEEAIRKQFGDVEILYISQGNIGLRDVEKYAVETAKIYKRGDIIVLSGPAILSVLATLYTYVKNPDQVLIAQYNLAEKRYEIYEISHLKIREKLTK